MNSIIDIFLNKWMHNSQSLTKSFISSESCRVTIANFWKATPMSSSSTLPYTSLAYVVSLIRFKDLENSNEVVVWDEPALFISLIEVLSLDKPSRSEEITCKEKWNNMNDHSIQVILNDISLSVNDIVLNDMIIVMQFSDIIF